MLAARYNELVREAARQTPLPGIERSGGATGEHHFKVRVEPFVRGESWKVFVGPGCVRDVMCGISYLRKGDPRGWEPRPEGPAVLEANRVYGENYPIVDRRLNDSRQDPPFLVATAPSAGDADDLGDFKRVPDTVARPERYRTSAMWEREIYEARVFLIAGPYRYTRFETAFHFALPTTFTRFRVAVAPQLPSAVSAQIGGIAEIAKLYLARVPGEPAADILDAQQVRFWSPWTVNVEPNPYGGFSPAFAADAPLTGAPFAAAFFQGAFAATSVITDTLLAQIAQIYETTGSAEFWDT